MVMIVAFVVMVGMQVYGAVENIAFGKKVVYSMPPDNPVDNPVQSKLTDGKINVSQKVTQKRTDGSNLVFCEERGDYNRPEKRNDLTIGWHWKTMGIAETRGVNLCIDLGTNQPLKKTAIRLASFTQSMFRFSLPCKISVLLSSDGINFYHAGTLMKTSTYGMIELSANQKMFALDENVDGWYPLEFDLSGLSARYVGLNIVAEGFMFYADEWSIEPGAALNTEKNKLFYKAENRKNFPIGNNLAKKDALLFGPEDDLLSAATNMEAPQLFIIQDHRVGDTSHGIEYVMELPVGMTLFQTSKLKKEFNITVKEVGTVRRYELTPVLDIKTEQYLRVLRPPFFGPLYFRATGSIPPDSTASFFCRVNGNEYSRRIVPVKSFVMPVVKAKFPFFAAITWMPDYESIDWPNFLDNYKMMGFNSYPVFPRYWSSMIKADMGSESDMVARISDAKKKNLKIIYNESPLHSMQGQGAESACTYSGAKRFCPSYRGVNYKENMNAIGSWAAIIQPDYLFWDIELIWTSIGGDPANMLKCKRCAARIKETGETPERYLLRCGMEIYKDLYQTVATNITNSFVIGHYDVHAGQKFEQKFWHFYQSTWSFPDAYPQYIQLSMPAAYSAGRLSLNHQVTKNDYEQLKKKWVSSTWITARTYGHCEPFKLEPMVYEQILNGGNINFFQMIDFTPLKLYYVALALQNISNYEVLLKNGYPDISFSGNNSALYYSKFSTPEESLILIANYTSVKDEKFAISLSDKKVDVTVISPIDRVVTVQKNKVTGTLRPAEFILLHVSN
jgi:hypothetical protein